MDTEIAASGFRLAFALFGVVGGGGGGEKNGGGGGGGEKFTWDGLMNFSPPYHTRYSGGQTGIGTRGQSVDGQTTGSRPHKR